MKKTLSLILLSALILALIFTAACSDVPKEEGAPNGGTPAADGTPAATPPKTEEPVVGDGAPADDGTTPPPLINETVYTPQVLFPTYPEDMLPASVTFASADEGDVHIAVTVDGYRSEFLGKDFFLCHDRPITLRVTVSNSGKTEIHKFLPTYCRGSRPLLGEDAEYHAPSIDDYFRHNHEVSFSLSDESGNRLNRVAPYFDCPAAIDEMTLPSEGTETYYFTLAAGTFDPDFLMLSAVGETDIGKVFADYVTPYRSDFFTFDNGIYSDTFKGEFTFSYISEYDPEHPAHYNDAKVSVSVELEILAFEVETR